MYLPWDVCTGMHLRMGREKRRRMWREVAKRLKREGRTRLLEEERRRSLMEKLKGGIIALEWVRWVVLPCQLQPWVVRESKAGAMRQMMQQTMRRQQSKQ
jgi:hypothetical protein